MRRRFLLLFLVIIMSACAPNTQTPGPDGSDSSAEDTQSEAPVMGKAAPGVSDTANGPPSHTAGSLPPEASNAQWLEVYAKLAEEPDEDDEPYTETVSVPDVTPTSLGVFTITAYCECVMCNGKWTGHKLNTPTQAGLRYPVVGYTVSVDPTVIPLGSVVELEGLGARYAQDTGSAIKGNKIDLFLSSHEEALEFGVKQLEVWIYS